MKTNEQIKTAEYLAKALNDYMVLAKAEKKLKTTNITNELNKITNEIKNKAEEL